MCRTSNMPDSPVPMMSTRSSPRDKRFVAFADSRQLSKRARIKGAAKNATPRPKLVAGET